VQKDIMHHRPILNCQNEIPSDGQEGQRNARDGRERHCAPVHPDCRAHPKSARILLITPSAKAGECADAIVAAVAERVEIVTAVGQATDLLTEYEFAALIIDQNLQEYDPVGTGRMLLRSGAAAAVYINFAITGADRVARELRIALQRRERDMLAARREAVQELGEVLNDTLIALLLSCEMALQVPAIPSAAATKLRHVYNLAGQIRKKLGTQSPETHGYPRCAAVPPHENGAPGLALASPIDKA
jgi:hypothetical protein